MAEFAIDGGGGGFAINIKVAHGSYHFNLLVPPQSTFVCQSYVHIQFHSFFLLRLRSLCFEVLFQCKSYRTRYGDVKSMIAQQTGLEPKQQKLLFRGIEKQDEEYLHIVGVKDNAKLLLMEGPATNGRRHEEIKTAEPSHGSPAIVDAKSEVSQLSEELDSMEKTRKGRKREDGESKKMSRGCVEVAEVRGEVDMLAEKVAALVPVINGGTKVEEKEFVVLSELLMRQLLKLDSIEAEGEGKVQRKHEVRRVQDLVDKVDSLKMVNSNPFSNSSKAVSLTTTWETFDSGTESFSASLPTSSSSTKVTQDWEQFY